MDAFDPSNSIRTGLSVGGYADGAVDLLQSAKGNPFHGGGAQKSWERCTIIGVSPEHYCCTVYTETGQYLSGVPFPRDGGGVQVPAYGSNDYAVHYNLGAPTLVASGHELKPGSDTTTSLTGTAKNIGASNPATRDAGDGRYRGNGPSDVVPGDWFKMGSAGNLIGVLEGGTTVIKASELAQIIMTQARNMLRIVGKNVRIDNGAGHIDFKTREGKSSLELRMGADEETEGSPRAENFRIRADLGTSGEMVDFRVTDGQGRSLYRQYIDPDGAVQIQCTSLEHVNEGSEERVVEGASEVSIGSTQTTRVGGTQVLRVAGNQDTKVNGDAALTVGANRPVGVGRDARLSVGRNAKVNVGGDPTSSTPAAEITVSNGDLHLKVGDPTRGDVVPGQSSFKLDVSSGDVVATTTLGGIKLRTTLPNSVELGGPGPAAFSTVIHEAFAETMKLVFTIFDNHVHPVPPPVPPIVIPVSGPPAVPMGPFAGALLPLSRSNYVKVGG